jgi:hypothetical protein
MSEKALEFTTPTHKAEGETNNTEQGIIYPPEIKAKLDLAMDKITKTEKGSQEELTALQAYQAEITSLTKTREAKEAQMMELVDFKEEQIHRFELEALEALVVQVNKGFAQQRIINKDFKAEDISLDDLEIRIEDNKVKTIYFNATVLAGDISKALEALTNLRLIYFGSLTSAGGFILPTTLNCNLNLRSLSSTEGLILPTALKGDLDLRSLSSAEGLILPTTVNGDLNLRSLSSAEGLILPTTVNGGLYLQSLKSAEGLILPTTLKGTLWLNRLRSAERNELRKKHPSFQIEPLD